MLSLTPWPSTFQYKNSSELVIIGAGLSGLFAALSLPRQVPVTILSARTLGRGASSNWAQGGIAAAVGQGDSPDAHAKDTIKAGAGLVDKEVAQMVAKEASDAIFDLLEFGVPFDKDLKGTLKLSREAAHSNPRVVRVKGDGAGAAIMAALIEETHKRENIRLIENVEVRSLKAVDNQIKGVYLTPVEGCDFDELKYLPCDQLLLATGGAGQLYSKTTNPIPANGAGMAMAARIGVVIMDAEFIQFHPTAMNFQEDPLPLATEALRGEGATLINKHNERFMASIHENKELAPRDIVARAVFDQLGKGLKPALDCTKAIGKKFPDHFPAVYGTAIKAGVDPVTTAIPVTPAAHYTMGGVMTDLSGRTSVTGLWAIGEVAATGLHGANRLASNSLLEAVVFAKRAAQDVAKLWGGDKIITPITHEPLQRDTNDQINTQKEMRDIDQDAFFQLRKEMFSKAGLIRDHQGLLAALKRIEQLKDQLMKSTQGENIIIAAQFILIGALLRKESRGAHWRADYPAVAPKARHSYFTLQEVNQHIIEQHSMDLVTEPS